MGKHKQGSKQVSGNVVPEETPAMSEVLPEATEPEALAPEPAKPNRYRVTLSAPTPIAFNDLEVEATGPDHAKQLFCERNGIDGSTQPWTITELKDEAPQTDAT